MLLSPVSILSTFVVSGKMAKTTRRLGRIVSVDLLSTFSFFLTLPPSSRWIINQRQNLLCSVTFRPRSGRIIERLLAEREQFSLGEMKFNHRFTTVEDVGRQTREGEHFVKILKLNARDSILLGQLGRLILPFV